jgi:hypothetical protein
MSLLCVRVRGGHRPALTYQGPKHRTRNRGRVPRGLVERYNDGSRLTVSHS